MLLTQTDRERIRDALWRFYDAAAAADMPETTRLATTIETWWPAVLVALTAEVTNARTEGFNRIIKQTKRVACGFRNMDNYQRRIMSHITLTRTRPATSSMNEADPAQMRRAAIASGAAIAAYSFLGFDAVSSLTEDT